MGDPDAIRDAVHRVHEAVVALEVEGVPVERIVVAGFGQGAALAVHAATSYPRTLGGCAMLSGYVPCTAAFKEATTPEGLSTRLLWLHGIHDAVVLTDAATAQAKMLLELGMSLDFRLSFDYGHETTDEELQALKHWLVVAIPQPEPEEDESDVPDYELPEGAENAEALYGEVQVRKTKAQKKA